ncbi:hypothetical protein Daus18300_014430 [Diaporthe australafricana]|uniref:C2H2-type domain-containing protein n=1 Tax=Diaporthe australafricana TaxID=127596 RepID=A0ABR3VV74_9PEZI
MQRDRSSHNGRDRDRDRDYAESLASLSLSDYHETYPSNQPYPSEYDHTVSDTYGGQYWAPQTGYPPAQSPPASGGGASYGGTYQTNAYAYPSASASASSDYVTDYPRYEYDAASIASSSTPSHSGRSSGMWSGAPSVGTAASSAPSTRSNVTDVNNTIHRQAPPNERYELPCEFSNLTGCSSVFHGDEEHDWIEHHIEEHLRRKLPSKLRCWFCGDFEFDAKERFNGDVRSNFTARMQHIRGHIVDDGYRFEQMQKDGHLVKHLLNQGLIDRSTYDSIVNPGTVPGIPGSHSSHSSHGSHGSHGRHRSHRSHRSHLPQVEEDVVAASSSSSGRRHRDHEPSSRSHGSRSRRSGP